MRTLGGFGIAVLLVTGGFAQQYRGNPTPVVTGGFGNIVHPGGTPSTVPGLTRSYSNVVNPGGGGPHLNVPYAPGASRPVRNHGSVLPYAYPVYFYPGMYDGSYGYYGSQGMNEQQQPNVTVVYPPQPAPVIINQFGPPPQGPGADRPQAYQPQAELRPDDAAPATEPAHYLIAFQDHTIYSAVAYWVDGETLHYFTTPSTHNQVSLSLIDRRLTESLNRESGMDLRLPPVK